MGLQLFLAYKSYNEREFILDLLKKLETKDDFLFIVDWFKVFRELDENGSFNGLVIPLSNYLYSNKTYQSVKEEFTNFVKHLTSIETIKYPIKINGKKIAIVRVGKKYWGEYIKAMQFSRSAGCNIVVLCGMAGNISNVANVTVIAKNFFSNIKHKVIIGTFKSKWNKPLSVIYVFFLFDNA